MKYNMSYMDSLFSEEFEYLSDNGYYSNRKLKAETYENAVVLPFVPDKNNSGKGFGGVVDSEGNYIALSATPEEELMAYGYDADLSKAEYCGEAVVYLGYFIKQWGHFIVDFLPRLWWLQKNYNGERVVILTGSKNVKIDGNFMRMLELFGITPDKLCIVGRLTRFKSVIIPEMSMLRPEYYTEESKAMFRDIVKKACSGLSLRPKKKIYFTRTRLRKGRRTEIGEPEIERLFKNNGFKVISPEKCSLKELVFYVSNADEIAALSGTIPHNIVFAKKGVKLIIINKNYRINTIQLMLNDFAGADVTYIDAHITMFPASPGRGPFWMHVNDNMLGFAFDNGFKVPKRYTTENRLVRYFSALKRSRQLRNYILMYCRLRDPELDIGGSVIGSARPDPGFTSKTIYFYYRNKLGELSTFTNAESFVAELYHYIKEGKL